MPLKITKTLIKPNALGAFAKEFNEETLFTTLFEYSFYEQTQAFKERLKELKTFAKEAPFKNTIAVCEEEKEEKPKNKKGYGGGYLVPKNLESLERTTFFDPTAQHDSNNKPYYDNDFTKTLMFAYNPHGGKLNDIFSDAVTVRAQMLVFFDTVLDILKSHWEDLEERASEGEKKDLTEKHSASLQNIKRSMEELNDLRYDAFNEALDLYKSLKGCANVFEEVDKKQSYRIYDMEVSHLSEIYKGLKALKEHADKKGEWNDKKEDITWENRKIQLVEEYTLLAKKESLSALIKLNDPDDPGDPLDHPSSYLMLEYLYDKIELVNDRTPNYILSKWDMMLRFAYRLKKINPYIDINLPLDAKTILGHEMYQNSKKINIEYTDKEEEFIENAMGEISNYKYVTWSDSKSFKSKNIMKLYFSQLLTMLNIYVLEELNMLSSACSDNQECQNEQDHSPSRIITLNDILGELRSILYNIHIDDSKGIGENGYTEVDYFRMLGQRSRYGEPNSEINSLFFRDSGRAVNLPVYEYVFDKFRDKNLAIITSTIKSNFTGLENSEDNIFLLPFGDDPVYKAIVGNYKGYVDKGFSLLSDVQNQIKEEGKKGWFGPEGGFRFRVNIAADINEEEEYNREDFIFVDKSFVNEVTGVAVPNEHLYIRESEINEYEEVLREFHVETFCVFIEDEEIAKKYCSS